MIRRPPRSTLFPYTTLFRSTHLRRRAPARAGPLLEQALRVVVVAGAEVTEVGQPRLLHGGRDGDHPRARRQSHLLADVDDDGRVAHLLLAVRPHRRHVTVRIDRVALAAPGGGELGCLLRAHAAQQDRADAATAAQQGECGHQGDEQPDPGPGDAHESAQSMPSTSHRPSGATRRNVSFPESTVTIASTSPSPTGTSSGRPSTRFAGTSAGSVPSNSSDRFLVAFGTSRSCHSAADTPSWSAQAAANAYATASGCAVPGLVVGAGGGAGEMTPSSSSEIGRAHV